MQPTSPIGERRYVAEGAKWPSRRDPVTLQSKPTPFRIEMVRSRPQPIAPIPLWIRESSGAVIKRTLRLEGWHGTG